jgi:hypothetical protein
MVMSLARLASAFAQTKPGGDTRSGSQLSQGPTKYFTGSVRIDPTIGQ